MSHKNLNPVNPNRPKRAAIVISNAAVSTTTGWPVGFWWAELTDPYFHLTEAGWEVDIYRPQWRQVRGRRDERSRGHLPVAGRGRHQPRLQARPRVRQARREHAARGQAECRGLRRARRGRRPGPDVHLEQAENLQRKFVEFYESGKVTAALCHGTAILRYATLSSGEPLVKGKTVTGFANIEEDFADQAVWDAGALEREMHVMPWRIEDEVRKLGGIPGGAVEAWPSATAIS
jgi:putative intracellular protease/amidase